MYKLIFADDEAIVRESIAHIIDWDSAGFQLVCCCSNGHELLEMVDSEQPDFVITDINMPFISGIDAVKQIKSAYGSIKTVLLTGYDEFEYAKEAIDLKVNKYILKPVTAEKLTDILGEIKAELDKDYSDSAYLSKLEQFYEQHNQPHFGSDMPDGANYLYGSYVAQARKYIEENYSDPKLSAHAVSEHLCISTSHFRAIFCSGTGTPFVKFLTLHRLEKAKQLLFMPGKKIHEIAEETGFSSSQYFCYCFKRHFDISPIEMRKKLYHPAN